MGNSNHNYVTMVVEGLAVDADEGTLIIALDRPDKRNAITYEMYEAINRMLETARDDEAVRAVVLTGKGSIFTAGHDVSGFARGLSMKPEEKPSFRFMQLLSTFPKPLIGAVNGDAIGIGATMLFHCDFVYLASTAKLKFPFMEMGLIPEFGTTFLGPQLFGHSTAMELVLIDGGCSAQEAVDLRIANSTHLPDDLIGHALGVGRTIASRSPEAVRETKRLMKEPHAHRSKGAIDAEAHAFHDLLQTDYVKAFLARRSGAK